MSHFSSANDDNDVLVNEIEILFPEITENDKIRTAEFLNAARGIVRIIEKLGKVFAPVKYDINGNIDKLETRYETNKEKNVILQDMILIEKATETNLIATDALLWLTRALHMILLFFEKIVEDAKTTTPTEDLVAFLKKSYKEALEPYHGWMAQQLFDVQLCKECIEWAKEERRTFLRQSLEARLIALYFDTGMYSEALQLGSALLKELKKLDDKQLLVEVQLLESKTYHALSNLAKARAALTSARTTANAIYCPPKMQAALDLQSGILHAADERDFKTAYSYFYEAFEGYDSVESPKALTALKYMLLSKIMLRTPEDVQSIMSGKLAVKYAGKDLDAMRAVAEASHRRSLADFQTAVKKYREELEDDVIVRAHLGSLYDAMLEQNLCRLVEPYSRVQVSHIATCISLPLTQVEKKLSQMILDKKLRGVLDQGEGVLIVFEDTPRDKTYEIALDTIHSMGKVVDTLYQKAKKLT